MLGKLRCQVHFWLLGNPVTWSRLLIQIHIINDNSADPDQLASEEANLSGSTWFAKAEHIWVRQDQETLWANSADNKLVIFFLFFPENRI